MIDTNKDPMETCTTEAFRVEVRPYYADTPDGTSDELSYFEKTGKLLPGKNDNWGDLITRLTARGVKVRRLRLISQPLSAYEQFELAAGYKPGLRGGEDIRTLHRDDAPDMHNSEFWLYDNHTIEVLTYTPEGYWLDSTIRPANPKEILLARNLKKLFFAQSSQVTDKN